MRLLVTRPPEDAARFVAALRAAGHTSVVAPLLEIAVHAETPDLADVQALLFTSANGVRAFAANSGRRDLPVFAVGDRTAEVAHEAGFRDVRSAAGDVEALGELATAQADPAAGALLHVAGSNRAGDLAGVLQNAGFAVRRAVLYEARPVQALPEAARNALAQGAVDGVGFFSPRTARSFVRLVRAAGLSHTTKGLTAVCLSPAVAEAARDLTWRDVRVAPTPTQEALLAQIGGSGVGPDGETAYGPPPYAQASEEDSRMAEQGETPRKPQDGADKDRAEAEGVEETAGAETQAAETDGAKDTEPAPSTPAASEGNVAETVIARFGGLRPTATKLGVAVSTVQGWKARGHIPPARHEEVRSAAAEHGIDLADLDLGAGAEPGEQGAAPGVAPGEPVPAEAGGAERRGEAEEASTDLAGVATAPGPNPWETAAGSGAPSGSGAVRAEGSENVPEAAREPAEPSPLPGAMPPPPKGGAGSVVLGLGLAIVLFAAGAVGAVYTRDIWQAYLPAAPADPLQQQVSALEQRLQALESSAQTAAPAVDPERVDGLAQSLEQLSARVEALGETVGTAPDGPAADSGALEELRSRVAALQERLDALPSPEADPAPAEPGVDPAQVAGLEQEVARLQSRVEGLQGELAGQPAAADAESVAALQGQVAELSGRLEEVSQRARQAATAQAGDSGFALALGQLRDALRFAAPFAAELQAVRALMPAEDPLTEALAPLAAHADTGVPTRDELRARFEPMARRVVAASYDESWSGRLMSRISEAVSVRPVGDVEGESARARIARADADLGREDLAGAVAELQGLEGEAAAAAQPWLGDAEARLAAEQALAELTRRTLERLTPAASAAAASE